MKIPNLNKIQWSKLYEHGDFKEIADLNKIDRRTIAGAYDGHGCTLEVFLAIQSFYDARQKLIDGKTPKPVVVAAAPAKKSKVKKSLK